MNSIKSETAESCSQLLSCSFHVRERNFRARIKTPPPIVRLDVTRREDASVSTRSISFHASRVILYGSAVLH